VIVRNLLFHEVIFELDDVHFELNRDSVVCLEDCSVQKWKDGKLMCGYSV